jgi:hypothetical protein
MKKQQEIGSLKAKHTQNGELIPTLFSGSTAFQAAEKAFSGMFLPSKETFSADPF